MKKFFLMAAISGSLSLCAQTDTGKTLDEIIVTANKFPSKSLQTGKVVTVITREDIQKAGAKSLSQVINEQGGVFINGANSNPGKDKSVYLRGARVEHTLITIDGIPVYEATGIGSNFDIRNIPIESVDRIEILKGSQGSLYGSDAVAGVVNIITRKAADKLISAEGLVSYGSYNSLRSSVALSGKKNKLDYRAGFDHFSTDGISEAAGGPGFDKDGFRQNGMQFSIGVSPVEKLKLQPFLRYSNIKGALDQDALYDAKDFNYTQKNLQAGFRNEFNPGKGSFKQLFQFTHSERDYLNDSADRNIYYEKNSFSNFRANEHFADLYYVRHFGKFTATIGTDYRTSNTEQVSFYNYGFGEPDTLPQPAKQSQVSGYGALNFISKSFAVEAGGRYNNHSKYGGNAAYNFNPSYRFGNRLKIFSNISSGYRTPGLYQLYSIYGNQELRPEESKNIEGGLQLFAQKLNGSFRAVYFYREVKNLIVFYTSPLFVSNYINRDRQKDHGVEIDTRIEIGKISLKAFYNYVDGNIYTKSGLKDTSFFNLYRRPKHSGTFTGSIRITDKLFTSLQVNHTGKVADIYFNPVTFNARAENLKAYTLLNFYAEYALKGRKLVAFTDLRNVLDEKYQEVYGYNTPGFNAYGGLRFKF